MMRSMLPFLLCASIARAATTLTGAFSGTPSSGYDDFNWNIFSYSDVQFSVVVSNGIGTSLELRAAYPRVGTNYIDITDWAISGTTGTATLSRTNLPAPRTYWTEILTSSGSAAHVVAAGRMTVHFSVFSGTNFAYSTNPVGNFISNPVVISNVNFIGVFDSSNIPPTSVGSVDWANVSNKPSLQTGSAVLTNVAAGAYVSSFNTRTGAVVLTGADIGGAGGLTNALAFDAAGLALATSNALAAGAAGGASFLTWSNSAAFTNDVRSAQTNAPGGGSGIDTNAWHFGDALTNAVIGRDTWSIVSHDQGAGVYWPIWTNTYMAMSAGFYPWGATNGQTLEWNAMSARFEPATPAAAGVESDPVWSSVSNAVTTNAANGNTAYGWGNHGTNGYVKNAAGWITYSGTGFIDVVTAGGGNQNFMLADGNIYFASDKGGNLNIGASSYTLTGGPIYGSGASLTDVWHPGDALTGAVYAATSGVALAGWPTTWPQSAITNNESLWVPTVLVSAPTVTITRANGSLVSLLVTNSPCVITMAGDWSTGNVGRVSLELWAGTNTITWSTNTINWATAYSGSTTTNVSVQLRKGLWSTIWQGRQ